MAKKLSKKDTAKVAALRQDVRDLQLSRDRTLRSFYDRFQQDIELKRQEIKDLVAKG